MRTPCFSQEALRLPLAGGLAQKSRARAVYCRARALHRSESSAYCLAPLAAFCGLRRRAALHSPRLAAVSAAISAAVPAAVSAVSHIRARVSGAHWGTPAAWAAAANARTAGIAATRATVAATRVRAWVSHGRIRTTALGPPATARATTGYDDAHDAEEDQKQQDDGGGRTAELRHHCAPRRTASAHVTDHHTAAIAGHVACSAGALCPRCRR
jgi:hypothetical protein